ncbi:hypothetical protein B0T22DRAFT_440753 [Podospora appendiculata]|uniref:Uncharacterized protein n=1 Tax=Podospora appendiculata TaxID=314037 RepID=A0AAE1CD67_9PEZI|nr:hypothetical protein B0T22DRAFT_440753 [Podospora appendiculata]
MARTVTFHEEAFLFLRERVANTLPLLRLEGDMGLGGNLNIDVHIHDFLARVRALEQARYNNTRGKKRKRDEERGDGTGSLAAEQMNARMNKQVINYAKRVQTLHGNALLPLSIDPTSTSEQKSDLKLQPALQQAVQAALSIARQPGPPQVQPAGELHTPRPAFPSTAPGSNSDGKSVRSGKSENVFPFQRRDAPTRSMLQAPAISPAVLHREDYVPIEMVNVTAECPCVECTNPPISMAIPKDVSLLAFDRGGALSLLYQAVLGWLPGDIPWDQPAVWPSPAKRDHVQHVLRILFLLQSLRHGFADMMVLVGEVRESLRTIDLAICNAVNSPRVQKLATMREGRLNFKIWEVWIGVEFYPEDTNTGFGLVDAVRAELSETSWLAGVMRKLNDFAYRLWDVVAKAKTAVEDFLDQNMLENGESGGPSAICPGNIMFVADMLGQVPVSLSRVTYNMRETLGWMEWRMGHFNQYRFELVHDHAADLVELFKSTLRELRQFFEGYGFWLQVIRCLRTPFYEQWLNDAVEVEDGPREGG